MTYFGDDLAPLLFPPTKGDFGFHQGKILTWNQSTAEGTVEVAGVTLVNVPVLNSTEVPLLEPGHIVGLMRWKTSYFMLGRIVIPGSSEVSSFPDAQKGAGATQLGFSVSTTRTPVASAVITVPNWANQALVMAVSSATVNNPTGTPQFVYNVATISGGWGGEPYTLVANGGYGHVSSSTQYLIGVGSYDVSFGGEIPLGNLITVTSTLRAGAALAASGSNISNIHAIAMFRKV